MASSTLVASKLARLPDRLERQPLLPTSYLKNRPTAEIKELEKKFQLTVPEMEEKLYQHRWMLNLNQVIYQAARYTNVTYPFYSAAKSYIGIQETFQRMFNIKVPYAIAYPVGIATNVLSSACWTFAMNPTRTAIKETLNYATQLPFTTRIANFCCSTGESLSSKVKYIFSHVALKSTNVTNASACFLGVSSLIATGAPYVWWPAFLSFMYVSYHYCDDFFNDAFWKSYEEFWSDASRPSLLSEFRHQSALASRAAVEGIVGVIMKAIQLYAIADDSRTEYGFWIPPQLVMALAAITCLNQYYPASYDFYMENKVETMKKLSAAGHNPESALAKWKQLEEKVLQNKICGYAVKEQKTIFALCSVSAGVGWYLGSFLNIFGAAGGALFMLLWDYKANEQRYRQKLIREENDEEIKAAQLPVSAEVKESSDTPRCDCTEVGAKIVGGTMNVGNSIAMATQNIGLASNVVGNSTPAMAAYIAGTFDSTVNNFLFMGKKLHENTKELINSGKSMASSLYGRLFNRSNMQSDDSQMNRNSRLPERRW